MEIVTHSVRILKNVMELVDFRLNGWDKYQCI